MVESEPERFRTVLARVLDPDTESTMTTVGQHLINQGRVEGRVEGIGKVLLQQLHQCFGDLPQRLVEQIHNAGEAELLRWTGRVLDASSPEEVLAGC